ncbi:MAG: hypothetical protein ABII90_08905 [Bacteroidota bacterium]
MTRLTIETDNAANAKFLASFLKNHKLVRTVVIEKKRDKTDIVQEPTEEYNWINPSRPATDEEIEQMLADCEKGKEIPAKISRARNLKKFKEWQQKNLK